MQIVKHTSPAAGAVKNPITLGKNIALRADTEEPLS
jgi:AICAR transformylase/IMP cyclohydrolase PurH